MANTFKVLFRGAATTGSTTLYTVPAATTTMITSILVVNTSATAQTYTLNLDGVSIATTVSVPANDTALIEPKQVLGATKTITGLASAVTVNFHITGLEITP
jgi:carbamate kinase